MYYVQNKEKLLQRRRMKDMGKVKLNTQFLKKN